MPWGGSEVLWSRLVEEFASRGHNVAFSIKKWNNDAPQIKKIKDVATRLERDYFGLSLWDKVKYKLANKNNYKDVFQYKFGKDIEDFCPDLVVVSQGGNNDGLAWIDFLSKRKIPYITISQAAAEILWPDSAKCNKMHKAFLDARLNLFVSRHNKHLTELEVGQVLENGKVIFNPFNVPFETNLEYPSRPDGCFTLANVARYEIQAKGHDVLLETLSDPKWKNRDLKVRLYGEGMHRSNIEKLIKIFDAKNVEMVGYEKTIEIWKQNEALILPSRYEGLPLALVESMLCGRMGIVTNVSGNTEVLQDNVTGFVAAAPKPEYLDEALERAWNRRDEWAAIGERCKAHIKSIVPADPVGEVANLILNS